LNELKKIKKNHNIITISNLNAKKLSIMYLVNTSRITCIYNQNFSKKLILKDCIKEEPLLIYIGSVALDRGIEDIIKLSYQYHILIIACNYKIEAIKYLEENCFQDNLTIYKGMNYEKLLIKKVEEYRYPFFIILINPTHPSYRYALPNKFFQAQAIGCPIIAYDRTYLGSIILKYKCGLIYPQVSTKKFRIEVDMDEYVAMKDAMVNKLELAISNEKL
ncbi:MAG: hypothetical protein Q4P13_07980, partial [Psychrobacter sp.]|nr:hypothetical protein [Psychrobacter sp.]